VKPNILILMVDQLAGTFFPDGPADFLHAPNLKALAARSARFVNNYTASPLCAPSRASFMSGMLPSRTQVYDNASEFASSIPTFAHHLRAAGYHTCLSGKMHFVGPDQLHGFEERLTTDVYPADFAWTPDWTKPGQRIDWWYHNLGSVKGAGVAEITNQLEYDDEIAHHTVQKLYQFARRSEDAGRQPWCLTVSFTHPHDPYVARRKYWDLYEDCANLDPEVGFIPYEEQDAHSKRLYDASDYNAFSISADDIRRSRRSYFANISYIDDHVGTIVDVLTRTRMLDDTLILFCSDHGDMLGERGLWFKMNFLEASARVPLMIAGAGITPQKITTPTSNIDFAPTVCDLIGIDIDPIRPWTDGISLKPLLAGEERTEPVRMEYVAEGSIAPIVGLRSGGYKFIYCPTDTAQLFDLEADPLELTNLAEDPAHADLVAQFEAKIAAHWDIPAFDAAVRESQARRFIVYPALRNGAYYPWDFQPLQKASERYMRNHMDLNVLEESQRFPRGE
jgi:choline-sulfatase